MSLKTTDADKNKTVNKEKNKFVPDVDVFPKIDNCHPVAICDYYTIHNTLFNVRIATYALSDYTDAMVDEAKEKSKAENKRIVLQWEPTAVIQMELIKALSLMLDLGVLMQTVDLKNKIKLDAKKDLINKIEKFVEYLKSEDDKNVITK